MLGAVTDAVPGRLVGVPPVLGSGIDEMAGGNGAGAGPDVPSPGGIGAPGGPVLPNGTIDPGGPERIGPKFIIGFMLMPGAVALSGGVFGAS